MYFQEIAVILLVAGAMLYLGLRLFRQAREKQCSKGCGCAAELKTKS